MKIFVISDIHGSVTAFNKAYNQFCKEDAEIMLICGDFLNHGPRNPIPDGYNPQELSKKLNELKTKIACVKGNCDGEVDQMLINFSVLDPTCQIFLPFFAQNTKPIFQTKCENLSFQLNGKIFAHHGHRLNTQQVTDLTDEGTIIVSGHTHIPVLKAENNRIFLNPGSITLPKEQNEPSYAIIEYCKNGCKEKLTISLKTLTDETIKNLVASV